jgi:hypothetical protein
MPDAKCQSLKNVNATAILCIAAIERFPRISVMLLGYLVLAVALFGLAAVIAEALVKNPDALLEVARDSERFARPALPARKATPSPANDASPRLAA